MNRVEWDVFIFFNEEKNKSSDYKVIYKIKKIILATDNEDEVEEIEKEIEYRYEEGENNEKIETSLI